MSKYITIKELYDQDVWTQSILGYKNIPAGAEVELIKIYRNLYGEYAQVKYDGHTYEVFPYDLCVKKRKGIMVLVGDNEHDAPVNAKSPIKPTVLAC